MRKFLTILLVATVSITACGKKKSSSAATAPNQLGYYMNNGVCYQTGTNTQVAFNLCSNLGYNPVNPTVPGFPAVGTSGFYAGEVFINNYSVYQQYLTAMFGYLAYNQGGYFGGQSGYSYQTSYVQCDPTFMSFLFGSDWDDCNYYQGQYYQDPTAYYYNYLQQIMYAGGAYVEFNFYTGTQVQGRFLIGYDRSSHTYREEAPFQGIVTAIGNGSFRIDVGPLSFVSNGNAQNYTVLFNNQSFGQAVVYPYQNIYY